MHILSGYLDIYDIQIDLRHAGFTKSTLQLVLLDGWFATNFMEGAFLANKKCYGNGR